MAYNPVTDEVAVADTYNHKIKIINNETSSIATLTIKWNEGCVGSCSPSNFYEPSSLCFNDNGRYLLVSDTNNHRIIRIDMKTHQAEPFPLRFGHLKKSNATVTDGIDNGFITKSRNNSCNLLKVLQLSTCKLLTIQISFVLCDDLRFTTDAPQKWTLNATNSALKSSVTHGQLSNGKLTLQLQRIDKEELRNNMEMNNDNDHLILEFCLSLCDDACCLMKRFVLLLQDDIEKRSNILQGKRQEKFDIEITKNNIKCN